MNLRTLIAGSPRNAKLLEDLGLLGLRLAAGGTMLFSHGLPKLMTFGERAGRFADPLGVGSTTSLALAVFAEVGCALLVMLGLATRWAALPLAFTMVIAAFVVHADDPWQKKEFALLYLAPFLALCLTGPGRFSVDRLISGR